MGKDLDELLDFIEEEAKAEGPEAVAELRRFDEEYALASQLLDLRLKADLSQQRLATLSGIPQSEISRIETGAANPTYATMRALAGPLGAASVGWFGGAAAGRREKPARSAARLPRGARK